MSLAIYAALAFALIIALIGAAFAILAGNWAGEGVESYIAADLTDLASGTAQTIGQASIGLETGLGTLVESMVDRKPAALPQLGQLWVSALKLSPMDFSSVGVADSQGRIVASFGAGNALGSDVSDQQWFADAKNGPVIIDQAIDPASGAGQPNITIATPVRDSSGARIGALEVRLEHPWIDKLIRTRLQNLPGYANAEVFVLNSHGQIVVSPPNSGAVAIAANALDGLPATKIITWPDQHTYLTAATPFALSNAASSPIWHVIARRSTDQALAPAVQMRSRIFLAAAGLTLVGALFGAVLANRIGRPLRLIASAADRISAGDLEVSIPSVSISGEISILSESLRSMVTSLRYNEARLAVLNESLEQRVFQRTAEIARAHNDLVVQEARLRAVIEAAIDGVLILDSEGRVEMFNQACERIFGWSAEEIVGRPVETLVADDLFIRSHETTEESGPGDDTPAGEAAGYTLTVRGRRRDGSDFPLEVSLSRSSTGGILFHVAILRDITDAVEAREQLYAMATEDSLTGVRNRRYFLEGTEMEFARTKRHGRDFSFLLIDADHFKSINDTYGHSAGDIVLKKIADLCSKNVREVDLIGRIGGEEFGIAMPEAGIAVARMAAERLRQTIAETTVETPAGDVRFTVSIGVASTGGGHQTLDELTRHADGALYQAKAAGRNTVVVADAPPTVGEPG